MKFNAPTRVVTSLLCIAGLFSACTKNVSDEKALLTSTDMTEIPSAASLSLSPCSINSIVINDGFGNYDRTLTFSYDTDGKPVSVLNDNPGTGAPNYFFNYDADDRLAEWIGLYLNGLYESWHRYGYDAENRIIKDTQWVFGTYGPEPDPNSYYIREYTYEYDNKGRIITQTIVDLKEDNPDEVSSFSYHGGNLDNGSSYDNKINLDRTNSVWLFINKDYSKNNSVAAVTYNSNKLPLEFNSADAFTFLGFNIEKSEITYTCP